MDGLDGIVAQGEFAAQQRVHLLAVMRIGRIPAVPFGDDPGAREHGDGIDEALPSEQEVEPAGGHDELA